VLKAQEPRQAANKHNVSQRTPHCYVVLLLSACLVFVPKSKKIEHKRKKGKGTSIAAVARAFVCVACLLRRMRLPLCIKMRFTLSLSPFSFRIQATVESTTKLPSSAPRAHARNTRSCTTTGQPQKKKINLDVHRKNARDATRVAERPAHGSNFMSQLSHGFVATVLRAAHYA
jgi:hypothetical protein